jgi:hypothetical protein
MWTNGTAYYVNILYNPKNPTYARPDEISLALPRAKDIY